MKQYFVTGATGVVGSSLVPVLLRDPEAHLHLLIRAGGADELSSRLEELYRFWGVAPDDAATRSRIEALMGDTTLPKFGLRDDVYLNLSASCTHIIHAAGLVRMNLPLGEARRSAVGSAESVVALARACNRLQKIDFVSTVGVGGCLPGTVPERWLTEPRTFHNTYEQAKAEAEDLLRQETARTRLPLTVHRPSMVVGDSRTGRIIGFQVFYFLVDFLSGRRTYGLYPSFGDARLDIIGCDIVAGAIAAASNDPQTTGRILHLCSGPRDSVRLEDLRQVVRRAFSERRIRVPGGREVPLLWFARLAKWASRLAPPASRRALSTLPIYLEYLADGQAFDDSGTKAWLQGRGLACPPPGAYVRTVLDFYLDRRYGGGVPRR